MLAVLGTAPELKHTQRPIFTSSIVFDLARFTRGGVDLQRPCLTESPSPRKCGSTFEFHCATKASTSSSPTYIFLRQCLIKDCPIEYGACATYYEPKRMVKFYPPFPFFSSLFLVFCCPRSSVYRQDTVQWSPSSAGKFNWIYLYEGKVQS